MLGGELAVLQAPMFDGLSLDPFAQFDDCRSPAEVGVGSHLRGTAPYRIGNVDYPAGRHRSILRERSEHMSHLYRGRGIVAFLKGQTGPQRKKDARQLNARYDRRQAGTP